MAVNREGREQSAKRFELWAPTKFWLSFKHVVAINDGAKLGEQHLPKSEPKLSIFV